MNMKISDSDYIRITTLAYQELIEQKCGNFLIHPSEFYYPDDEIIITSMQDYAHKAGIPEERLIPADCWDGYVYRNSRPGRDLILYNARSLTMRMRFTVAHEIGHARLKHKQRGNYEEAEAHLYASQLLAPDIVLWKIRKIGCLMSPDIIASLCGLSSAAAEQKCEDYQICRRLSTPYDQALLLQFQDFFSYRCIPTRRKAIEVII